MTADPLAPAPAPAEPRRGARRATKLELPPQVRVLSVMGFLVAGGFGIIGPAIPLLAKEYDASAAAAGLAISAFAAFRLVFGLCSGPLVNRLAERPVLVAGLVLQSVTSIAAGFAPNFESFVALRAVGGLGSAAFTVSSMTLMLRVVPADRRGRAMSVYQGGFVLGAVTGPAVGGVLAEISPRVPLIVYGTFLLLASIIGLRKLTAPPDVAPDPASDAAQGTTDSTAGNAPRRSPFRETLRKPTYLMAIATAFCSGWTMYGMRNSLIPLYVVDGLGRTATWAGLALFAGAVTQGLLLFRTGHLVDAWGAERTVRIGLAAAMLSMLVTAMLASVGNLIAALLLLGLAGSLLATSSASLLGAAMAGRRDATAVAGFSVVSDLGAISSPVLCGLLVDSWSFRAAFLLCASVSAVVLMLSLLMRRRLAEAR